MDSLSDLINIIKDLFFPPKRYLQDNPKNDNSTNPCDNGDSEEYTDSNYTCDIILGFVNNIQLLYLDIDKYRESIEIADADENHDQSNIKV